MVIAAWCRAYRTTLLRLFLAPYACPLFFSSTLRCRTSPISSISRSSDAHICKTLPSHLPSSFEIESNIFKPDSYEGVSDFFGPNVTSFLQLLSHAKSEYSTEDEALCFLRSSSAAKPNEDLLCSVLWELRSDWESTILALRWIGDCILESPRACHLMIWGFGSQRRFDLAWMILRRIHRKSLPTSQALVIMMERYAFANEIEKAIKVFHALEKFNVKADMTIFYSLLRALCKHKNIQEAEELLLVNRCFFPLEASGFNIILDGWCNILVDLIEAKRVWRDMARYCIVPDVTSYTHMISCFTKHGNLFDSLKLYNEMKKRGLIPTLKVYNCLIYILTKEGCIKEAHKIFNKITEVGLQPELETYNSMILSLCEKHKLDEAQEVLKMMISGGICPSMETYHAFVKIEDFEGIIKLIEQMRENGCLPNESTFLLILKKFFSMDKPESALRIWSEMRKYDVIPETVHYITMVKGLATDGWILKAMEFYSEMKSKGFLADPELDHLLKGILSNNEIHYERGIKEYFTGKQQRSQITRDLKTR